MNLDLDDIKIMLENSGEGQDKVKLVTKQIINSPFIKNLPKARKILLSIIVGADQINMLWGYIMDAELEDKIEVEMLITDFFK